MSEAQPMSMQTMTPFGRDRTGVSPLQAHIGDLSIPSSIIQVRETRMPLFEFESSA